MQSLIASARIAFFSRQIYIAGVTHRIFLVLLAELFVKVIFKTLERQPAFLPLPARQVNSTPKDSIISK